MLQGLLFIRWVALDESHVFSELRAPPRLNEAKGNVEGLTRVAGGNQSIVPDTCEHLAAG